MHKKMISYWLLTVITLSPLITHANVGEACDPQTHFCFFIRADASLATDLTLETMLSLTINRVVSEYPGKLSIKANAFQVIGLPTKFLSDAKVSRLKLAITSIEGQTLTQCEVSSPENKTVLPGMKVIMLSATRDNNEILYHCSVDE